jgi:hypothetical protein
MRKPRLGNQPRVPMSVKPYIHRPDALRPTTVNCLPLCKIATMRLLTDGLAQSTSLLTTITVTVGDCVLLAACACAVAPKIEISTTIQQVSIAKYRCIHPWGFRPVLNSICHTLYTTWICKRHVRSMIRSATSRPLDCRERIFIALIWSSSVRSGTGVTELWGNCVARTAILPSAKSEWTGAALY